MIFVTFVCVHKVCIQKIVVHRKMLLQSTNVRANSINMSFAMEMKENLKLTEQNLIWIIFHGLSRTHWPYLQRRSIISNWLIYQSGSFSNLWSSSTVWENNVYICILSVLCSSLKSTATTILTAINLDSNSIEHIANDPFKFCPDVITISMSNNSISRLPSGKLPCHVKPFGLVYKIEILIVFF